MVRQKRMCIPQTSTQVMRASVCSPSADSGRPVTSLRRTKGPSCGSGSGGRAVSCGLFTASAIVQEHHTRHAGYGRDVQAMFLAVEEVPRYKLVNAGQSVPPSARIIPASCTHALDHGTWTGLAAPISSYLGGHNALKIAHAQRRSQL
jgi:hypothetical protein